MCWYNDLTRLDKLGSSKCQIIVSNHCISTCQVIVSAHILISCDCLSSDLTSCHLSSDLKRDQRWGWQVNLTRATCQVVKWLDKPSLVKWFEERPEVRVTRQVSFVDLGDKSTWHPTLWSKEPPPPRGGFLFTMFPHQEPCVRGPPSKNRVQILRGGSSYTRFLMREHIR